MSSNHFEELPDDETRSLTPPPLSQNREQQTSTPSIPPLSALDEDEDTPGVLYTIAEVLAAVERSHKLKLSGNLQFAALQYPLALETYREGLVELPLVSRTAETKRIAFGDLTEDGSVSSEGTKSPEESEARERQLCDDQVRELRGVLSGNVAATLIKLERWKDAVEACDDALLDKPNYVKVLYRRAMSNEAIKSWSSLTAALEDYETLNSLSSATATVPSAMQKTISDSLRRLPPLIAEQQEKEKDEVLSKLKDLGNTVLGKFGFSTDNFKFTQQASGGYSMNFGQ